MQKPPSASRLPLPPLVPRLPIRRRRCRLPDPFDRHHRRRAPFCFIISSFSFPSVSLSLSLLLVRAFSLFLSLHVEGIHSRNSLLRGLFCCNRCCPPPVPAQSFRFFCTAPLPPFFLPSVVLSFFGCCFSQPDTSFASHARTVEDARPRHVDRRSYRPFSYII